MSRDMHSMLDAPCEWCRYSGEKYWQAGSHAHTCPWFAVASSQARLMKLERGEVEQPKVYKLQLENARWRSMYEGAQAEVNSRGLNLQETGRELAELKRDNEEYRLGRQYGDQLLRDRCEELERENAELRERLAKALA